ncbi:MAG: hypothetical protein Q8S13_05350, partial [Dehalococcoidia bacterium]|nr:hypothetical protein [Dehalococcoidia bacterium]
SSRSRRPSPSRQRGRATPQRRGKAASRPASSWARRTPPGKEFPGSSSHPHERPGDFARVGHIDFGTGDGDNGYDGDEDAGPWAPGSAVGENGCYFGAIYRARPAPHNNLLAHRLRLAFIDSDKNLEGWSQIWVPGRNFFVPSGWHPVVLGAVVGREAADAQSGPPFMTHAADGWNAPGRMLAADGYGDGRWYDVCFARFDGAMAMSIDGEFRYGGRRAYVAALPDAGARLPGFDGPHYWLAGDPHINYYEGAVLIDDVRISVWRDAP